MSTPFYDLASVVVLPSGYKSGKIYAQKPLTTDGQLTFTRASTATRVNASGLIETVSSGVPRLDYQGSTCPKLLLEPQRTNALTNSQDFSTGYFSTDVAVTTNTTASPDGTTNADTITEGTANDLHRVGQNFSATSGATYTASIFCKAGNGTRNLGILFGCGFGEQEVVFNVNNGTIVASSGATGTITNYGNGWYRCAATATSASTVSACVQYQLRNGTTQSYLGNGTSTLIYWGAMVEAGAYTTSYIPTTSAAVTRLADDITPKSVALFNAANDYSFFFEIQNSDVSTASSWLYQSSATGGPFQIYGTTAIISTSSGYVYPFSFTPSNNASGKCCVTLNGTTIKIYLNGVKVGQYVADGQWANKTNLDLSYDQLQKINYKQILLFPSALTEAQAIELTKP